MKVVIGSDHAGFQLKQELGRKLLEWGHELEDVGTHDGDPVDYPDVATQVATRVRDSGGGAPGGVLGLLVCGTGIGVSIAANKLAGIRAARCDDPYSAQMARAHNDANVLCIGSRVIGVGLAETVVRAFLDTAFEGGRHQRRVDKINQLDS